METTLMSSGILNCLPIPSPPLRAASSSTSCFATSTSAQNLSFLTHQCRHSRRRAAAGGVLAPPLTTFSVRKLSSITCAAGAAVKEISEAQFSDTVLKSNCPVLVEFVAGWCGPCRLISPAIEAVAQEYKDKLLVVKIDHDANPQLIEEYKVYGLPALILFKDGEEVPESRREGAITKAKLKEYIDELLESVSVSQLQDFLSVTAIL